MKVSVLRKKDGFVFACPMAVYEVMGVNYYTCVRRYGIEFHVELKMYQNDKDFPKKLTMIKTTDEVRAKKLGELLAKGLTASVDTLTEEEI